MPLYLVACGQTTNMNDIIKLIVRKKLERFLAQRKEKFPNLTEEQKTKWANNAARSILLTLGDNDIFYDNMPYGVVEV